ncbi:MAG: hypothetical protein RLZZ271_994 [Pseudomonadota bacterium]
MTTLAEQPSSTRPYLIRAIYEWCTDNGLTPYLAVHVDAMVRVPMEHVKDDEIVLNISFDATSGLKLGNDLIEFKARFSGTARDISVPVDHVIAIYARENGQGMAFPAPNTAHADLQAQTAGTSAEILPMELGQPSGTGRPAEQAPVSVSPVKLVSADKPDTPDEDPPPDGPKPGVRPILKRVK